MSSPRGESRCIRCTLRVVRPRFVIVLVCAPALGACGGCDETQGAATSSEGGSGGGSSQSSGTTTTSGISTTTSSSSGGQVASSSGTGGAGGTGGGSGGSGGLAIDPVCAAYGDTRCARLFECLPYLFEWIYGDATTCAAAEATICTLDLSAPGSARTPAVVQACSDASSAASCEAVIGSDVAACHVLPGQLPAGTACGSDWQCEGRRCVGAFENGCGTCQTPAGAGEPCADDYFQCEDGLACIAKICVLQPDLGQPCDASTGCAGFLACSDSTGTCVPSGAVGDSCVDAECNWSIGSFCDGMQCIQGQNADIGDECSPTCKGGICVTMLTSECTARPGEGDTCNSSFICQIPLRCVADVCTLVDPAGC